MSKEDTFILPEKWCIKPINEEIVEYLDKYGTFKPYTKSNTMYAHFPSSNTYTTFTNIQDGYIEITFEQFKKYILKIDPKNESELDKLIRQSRELYNL